MKCNKCGHELIMEAAYCEKCGSPNVYSQQHAKAMRIFKSDYLWTKSGVDAIADNFSKVSRRLALIAILLALNVVALVIGSNAESINRFLRRCDAGLHAEKYAAELEQYLEDENYLAIYSFANRHGAWMSDAEEYDTYQDIIWASNAYSSTVKEILRLREINTTEVTKQIGYIVSNLEHFYDEVGEREVPKTYGDAYVLSNQKKENAYERMELELYLLLQEYCNLTEQEVQTLRGLTSEKRALLLEEGMERK